MTRSKVRGRRPGRPPASDRARVDARRRLLDAAAKAFAQDGYAGATVDGIVAAAGLSKGTFYWHFRSKEELFVALLEQRIDAPARSLMEVTRSAPAEASTAPVVSRGLATLFKEERELVLLLHEYWSAAARDEGLRSRYLERQAGIRDALAEALAARHEETGVPLTLPATELATAFVALAEGLTLQALVDPDSVGEDLYGEILSLVYDGIAARGRSVR